MTTISTGEGGASPLPQNTYTTPPIPYTTHPTPPMPIPTTSGRPRDWDKAGFMSKVTLYVRTSTLRAARDLGINTSAVLQTALSEVVQSRMDSRIEGHKERLIRLESEAAALRAVLQDEETKAKTDSEAATMQKAQEEAVQKALPFFRSRVDKSDDLNLAWCEDRAKACGMKPYEFLMALKAAQADRA